MTRHRCDYRAADVASTAAAEALFRRLLQSAAAEGQLGALLRLLQGPWRDAFESSTNQQGVDTGQASTGPKQHVSFKRLQVEAAEVPAETEPAGSAEEAAAKGDGWEHEDDLDLTEVLSAQQTADEPNTAGVAAEGPSGAPEQAADSCGDTKALDEEVTVEQGAGLQPGTEHSVTSSRQGKPPPSSSILKQQGSSSAQEPDLAPAEVSEDEQPPAAAALHACWAALLPRMLAQAPGADAGAPLAAEAMRCVEATAARAPFLLTPAEAALVVEACRSAGKLSSLSSFGGKGSVMHAMIELQMTHGGCLGFA